jgi:hypothetical protein
MIDMISAAFPYQKRWRRVRGADGPLARSTRSSRALSPIGLSTTAQGYPSSPPTNQLNAASVTT